MNTVKVVKPFRSRSVCPDLGLNCLQRLSSDNKRRLEQGESLSNWANSQDNGTYLPVILIGLDEQNI